MKPSRPGLLCARTFLIIALISSSVISLFRLSASYSRHDRHGWIDQVLREGDGGLRNKETESKQGQAESRLWDVEEGTVCWQSQAVFIEQVLK